ncbi:SOS response-associated peptidase [Ferrimonas balearica]|uniref:SOS response-associated peptidase n=1 Tax=Ferrimonas balearica TaxID=44012 RepID=UPI001C993FE0|nr:SOS response-associated peptidase family protein [Ferrimonas balearica]MBY5921810.1 SOS response-associated peptidase [Ferrimonas balearica]MBY5994850.1 SOS response-associated peptidase [Ferrimonas balearica]
MCGHFALDPIAYDSHEQLGMDGETLALRTASRIRPTESISILTADHNRLSVATRRWGINTPQSSRPVINARLESLAERPLFRPALGHRQCLIPATAWYEWRKEGRDKVGYRFAPEQSGFWHFAGLWWPPSDSLPEGAAVIVTAEATGAITEYHHRMPLCLSGQNARAWLEGKAGHPEPMWAGHICPMDRHRPVQPRLF